MSRATPEYNLAVCKPEVAKSWHPTKNGNLTPFDVTPFTAKEIWWLCDNCGHEYVSKPQNRTASIIKHGTNGCPACGGVVVTANNNLQAICPNTARQWHPTKNGKLKPSDVKPNTHSVSCWWMCDRGHEWQATPQEMTRTKRGKLGDNCRKCWTLAVRYPEVAKQWHPTKNGSVTPEVVAARTSKKAWWLCGDCGYDWETQIKHRVNGSGCPYCAGRVARPEYNLEVCYPEVAKQWHPTKNGKLKPSDVLPYNTQNVWWLCECGCEWQALPSNQINIKIRCPECQPRTASESRNLKTERPELAKQWHPTKNGKLKPSDVLPFSNMKVWWLCNRGHEWKADISSRSDGRGCAACAGKIVTPEYNLEVCYPELAKQWHPTKNGNLRPSDVLPSSGKKIWWRCDEGHSWQATCGNRTWNKSGCPTCHRNRRAPVKTRGEILLNFWSKKLWPYETSGKREVCEMIQMELDRLGYSELNFLSLPGNGREIRQLLDAGFDFNYDDCLGVEKYKAKALQEFLRRLFMRGELGGIMPVIRDDIDKVLTDGRLLPEFNAIHLDYNGPLTLKHLLATETALRKNPDAVVAVTVQSRNAHGLRMDYRQGDFPFLTVNPELLFFQPYAGVKGCPMETYCFIGDASSSNAEWHAY